MPIARFELIDEVQLDAINKYFGFDYPVMPTLFMEFDGDPKSVEEQIETARAVIEDHRGGEFRWAIEQEKRDALWQARHNAAYAMNAYQPGA